MNYAELNYSRDEVQFLLERVEQIIGDHFGFNDDDWQKLADIVKLDFILNLSRFDGTYESLLDKPDIPVYISELSNNLNYTTLTEVNEKLSSLRDELIDRINDVNSGFIDYMNTSEFNIVIDSLRVSLKKDIDDKLRMLNLSDYASTASVERKANKVHIHEINDVELLADELDNKSNKNHTHEEYASKFSEHSHDNLNALNNITQLKIDSWVEFMKNTTADVHDVWYNEDFGIYALWSYVNLLHATSFALGEGSDHTHDNLDTLDKITELEFRSWTNKAENKFITTDLVPANIGGIKAGDNLNGMGIHEILEALIYPYIQPEVFASIVKSPNANYYEYGQNVSILSITANVVKKSKKISKIDFIVNNSTVKTLNDISIVNGGSFTYTLDTEVTTNTSLPNGYFQVLIQDASNTVITKEAAVPSFVYPFYYGVLGASAEITEGNIKSLTKVITPKASSQSRTYTASNQRMVIAYPSEYGNLKSILDPNGFEQISAFTKYTVLMSCLDNTVQQYNVYANSANTNTNFKMTFKF